MGYSTKLLEILDYVRGNAMGQPEGEWFNRVSGRERPSIYAEPKNEMLLSQSSGYWRGPLAKVLKFLTKNPKASRRELMDGTGLDRYHVETIKELIRADNVVSKQK